MAMPFPPKGAVETEPQSGMHETFTAADLPENRGRKRLQPTGSLP
jgi:hypothetical protein